MRYGIMQMLVLCLFYKHDYSFLRFNANFKVMNYMHKGSFESGKGRITYMLGLGYIVNKWHELWYVVLK